MLLSVSACGGKAPSGGQDQDGGSSEAKGNQSANAALVIAQGGLGDEAYNDLAYKGFKKGAETAGIEGRPIESNDIVAEGEQLVRTAANSGYGLVADLEFSHADMLSRVAPEFPDTNFAIVNAEVKGDNVTSILFKEHEGSYLAGVLAASQTTNTDDNHINKEAKIGFIGGTKSTGIDKFLSGYMQGAQSVNSDIKVDVRYVDSFGDAAKGQQIAEQMYGNGTDIIFASAGGSGAGVIQAAESTGHYVIGVDSDQDDVAPGYVLTSMIKQSDLAMDELITDFANGEVPSGKTIEYGLKEDGVGLSDMKHTRKNVSDDTMKEVEQAKKDIINGDIEVWDVTEQGYPTWLK